jgi:hypothetical protein
MFAALLLDSGIEKMTDPLEKEIERNVIDYMRGGLDFLEIKLHNRSYPDRLILLDGGRAIFIEFKRSDQKLRFPQNFIKALIEKLGFEVYVVREKDKDEIRRFIDGLKQMTSNDEKEEK